MTQEPVIQTTVTQEPVTPVPGEGPVVDVHDVFCLHPVPDGAVAALRGLTLRVGAGEAVVVHGPNGSGKTTLLRVLAGWQPVSAGRAVVAGLEVGVTGGARARRELARWRATRLGWVDQHPARTLRPELDVLANVGLQLRLAGVTAAAARTRAAEALERMGIARLARRSVVELSGGEAQRVAVCAALAHGPALVLADEPTGELDRDSAARVYRLLAEASAQAGAALVLVSHDPRAAVVADRVVRIRDGRLSETWRPLPGDTPAPELLVVDERGWVRIPDRWWAPGGSPVAVAGGPSPDGRPGVLLVPRDLDGPAPGPGPSAATGTRDADSPHTGTPDADTPGIDTPDVGTKAAAGAEAPARPGEVLARVCGVRRVVGDRVVLDGVDLTVTAGRLLVVRGASGTGKSTLLRLLTGLDRPDAGTVELAGTDLAGLDRAGLAALRRRALAVVGQDVRLAETVDVAGNLELARAVRGLPPDPEGDRLRLAGLGLAMLADRQVRMLSGGERQRVAVARALVTGVRVLVLDEPSSQLDEARAEQLAGVLRDAAAEGRAVVVTSHDPTLVAAADDVLDLEPAALPEGRDQVRGEVR